ncbi:MAG: serine/threonine protein kinase [Verrucomicrobia bacterium]|nr:MAG: serine/threonine protein kinase [Verrucomicrobiota bacterium]
MKDAFERELAVFSAARRLPAAERAGYLDQTCAGDAPLRARVDELLAAAEKAPAFLIDPAPGAERPVNTPAAPTLVVNTAASAEKAGDRIGHYKLLQQIGEGGCGLVYMAEQEEPVRRRVALKVIKLGMDTKSVIARFEAERQALAMMDHPNIAKVLDAGATQAGRPYFVMELVKGIKVTEYCDEHNLSTNERLELFIQVCHAVQHAHQKGIIHRDLKPSNILVASNDGVPVPKVIDFGIAKATLGRLTDQTLFTAFEQFIGTPAYMSPEQAELTMQDVDARTDIYSLGVLLYELLTGKTPFDAQQLLASGLDAMRRTIREKEPVRPSTRLSTMLLAADVSRGKSTTGLAVRSEEEASADSRRRLRLKEQIKLVRGDLDWIVMRCLEKDRSRRYETANGLAMDVRRHLADEPVVARPPSKLYRFQKLVLRNQVAFAAAAGIIAALILGLIFSIYGLTKAEQQRRKAQASEKKAQDEATKSSQVAQFLNDVLKSMALGRDTTVLREILDKTGQRVGIGLTNQPEVEAELRYTLGEIYFELRDWPKAESMHRQALQLRRNKLGDAHPATALSMSHLGRVFLAERKWADADTILREALNDQRRLNPQSADVAFSLNELSVAMNARGKTNRAEVEQMLREALPLQRTALGQDSPEVATTLEHLQQVLRLEGKWTEAESAGREALALRRKHPDDQLALASSLEIFASIMDAQNRRVEAEPLFREALSIQRTISGNEHPAVARRLTHLAWNLRDQGKLTEAEGLLTEALEMRRKLLGREHLDVAETLQVLAELKARQRSYSEAEPLAREALEILRSRLGPGDTKARQEFDFLWRTLAAQEKWVDAETLLNQAIATQESLEGDGADTTPLLQALVQCLERQGRASEAEARLTEAIQRKRRIPERGNSLAAPLLLELSDLLKAQGKLAESVAVLRDAAGLGTTNPALYKIPSRTIPARDPGAGTNLIDLSMFYNAALTERWHGPGSSDLSELPRGLQSFAGVQFDVRGLIQLAAAFEGNMRYPDKVRAIPVRQTCRRLHFLHAAIFGAGAPSDVQIGSYVVHFASGKTSEFPIVMGQSLADWWNQPNEQNRTFTVAWMGQNGDSRREGRTIRLFKSAWDNPTPDEPVGTIDFIASRRAPAPFLVAITAEP